jgi:integrase
MMPSLAELFMEYLSDFLTQGGGMKTYENYRVAYSTLIKLWPEVSTTDFEGEQFLTILDSHLPTGWKPSSRKQFILHVGLFANWLARAYRLGHRRQLPRINKKPKQRALPTDEEIEVLKATLLERSQQAKPNYEACYKQQYLIVCLLEETGARISEVLWLRAENLQLENDPPFIVIDDGKTDAATRAVAISAHLAQKLRAFKSKQGIARGIIFRTRNGKPFSRNSFTPWLTEFCRELGIKCRVTPHLFRHRKALKMIIEGKSAIEVMTRLGHEDVAMTVYYFNQVRRLYPMVAINGDVAILEKQQRFWRENTNTRRSQR